MRVMSSAEPRLGVFLVGDQLAVGAGVVGPVVAGVAGQLGEQVAVPQDHRVAQQVRNDVDDAAVGHDVPDARAVLVPVDHLSRSKSCGVHDHWFEWHLAPSGRVDDPRELVRLEYMYSYLMARKPLTAEERAFGTELGRVIAERRREAQMTGQALADGARLSVDGLRKLETGRVFDPGFRTVLCLAQSLGVSLDQLVEQVTARRGR